MAVSLVALGTTVAIFLVLFGAAAPWSPTFPGVTEGESLQKRAAWEEAEKEYGVTCVIDVENWLNKSLEYPRQHLLQGAFIDEPTTIGPATREAFAVRIDDVNYRGAWGTASWMMDGFARRFVFLFSVLSLYRNLMAVGVTSPKHNTDQDGQWWDHMRYYSTDSELTMERKPCSLRRLKSGRTCKIKKFGKDTDLTLIIDAVMTGTPHTKITVKVKPTYETWEVLAADSLQQYKPT